MRVKIANTKHMGRSLVATCDIAAGNVVLRAVPAAAVLLDTFISGGTHCGMCLADAFEGQVAGTNHGADLIKCADCNVIFICKACRSKAQTVAQHGLECNAHASLLGSKQRGLAYPLKETSTVRCLIRLMISGSKSRGCPIQAEVADLEEHFDSETPSIKTELQQAATIALSLISPDYHSTVPLESVRRWARVAARLRSNEIAACWPMRWNMAHAMLNLGDETCGVGLWPAASYCNHNSTPNCHYSIELGNTTPAITVLQPKVIPNEHVKAHRSAFIGPNLVLRATRRIRRGEHVYISYVSLYAPIAQRNQLLQDMYHFQETDRARTHHKETLDVDACMTALLCQRCPNGILEPTAVQVVLGIERDRNVHALLLICTRKNLFHDRHIVLL